MGPAISNKHIITVDIKGIKFIIQIKINLKIGKPNYSGNYWTSCHSIKNLNYSICPNVFVRVTPDVPTRTLIPICTNLDLNDEFDSFDVHCDDVFVADCWLLT